MNSERLFLCLERDLNSGSASFLGDLSDLIIDLTIDLTISDWQT